MVQRGIDYSWARPGGAAIREAGFTFVMRYVPYPGDDGKGLTPEELADLHAHGLGVGLVFESLAARASEGYPAGNLDALECANALARLGWPVDRPVYFAVDFDAQPSHFSAITGYLRGAASVLGLERVGVYGSFAVVKYCKDEGVANWLWQTYAWSGGRKYEGRHVYQHLNGQSLSGRGPVDYNEGYGDDFGVWFPETEESMPEGKDKALMELNAAIVKRFDIIGMASDCSERGYDRLQKAHKLLKDAGLL